MHQPWQVGVHELYGGDVHGNPVSRFPSRCVLAGLVEYPRSKGSDQPVFLGNGNELGR